MQSHLSVPFLNLGFGGHLKIRTIPVIEVIIYCRGKSHGFIRKTIAYILDGIHAIPFLLCRHEPCVCTAPADIVKFKNGDIELNGTLTLPAGCSKKTPVLVMVTGSGQQDRDEMLFEHRPFAVIADALARNGIASLRYDDRGYGDSTVHFLNYNTHDFKDDAAAEEGSGQKVIAGLMEMVLEDRAAAKAAKDWPRSDAIRDKLKELGITVKDTKNGAEWTIE